MMNDILRLACCGSMLISPIVFVIYVALLIARSERSTVWQRGDMSSKAFILQKSTGQIAVYTTCLLDTYYNYAFSKSASTHYSFSIADDTKSTNVYAAKHLDMDANYLKS